jgi:uncharacterized RDD family membrane protein YckC
MGVAALSSPDVHVVVRRILALLIDLLILGIIMFFVNGTFGSMHVTGGVVPINYTTTYIVDWPWYFILPWAYFFILEARFSYTVGKRLMGLIVVDSAGQPVTLRAALLRNLLRFVDVLPCFYLVGGMIMLLLPQRQRIGDLAARTLVVRRDSVPAPYRTALPERRARLASYICILLLIGCAIFVYFARPVQVIAEMRVTSQSVLEDKTMTDLTLGSPSWGFGTVTYPIRYNSTEGNLPSVCRGEITLRFLPGLGWGLNSSGAGCQAVK